MKRPIPYGVANYAELVRDQSYFVDKTRYIEQLERVKNPVFPASSKIREIAVVPNFGMLLQPQSGAGV